MLQKTGVALRFFAHYTEGKLGKTGLTVTCDVWRIPVGGAATLIVSGAAATEIGKGGYMYELAAASNNVNGEYFAVFNTATTTVDAREVPSLQSTPVWLATLGEAAVEFVSPVSEDGKVITIVHGDDYNNGDGNALSFASIGTSPWPDISGGTVKLSLRNLKLTPVGSRDISKSGTVVTATQARFELTSAETGALPIGEYVFDLEATLANGRKHTLVRGRAHVLEDIT